MAVDTSCIVRNTNGRVIGRIEGKVFIKEVYGSKHMLRKPLAWAIDCDIFNRVISPLCFSIHIIDKDTKRRYVCGVTTFRAYCHKLNRRFGDQYYLELVHWRVQGI